MNTNNNKVMETAKDKFLKKVEDILKTYCLEAFIKECGMVTSLRELGATKEMLPLIAKSTVLGGGYKKLNAEDILTILEECY